MKVKCKSSNKFLIKGEWYQVNQEYMFDDDSSKHIMYCLINHTDRKWNTTWYNSINFYTLQELREKKLNKLGI